MSKKRICRLSILIFGAFFGAIFFLGCGDEVEKKIDTSNLVADFSVIGNNNSVKCRAQFWEGSKTNLSGELSNGDQVWCQGNMMVKKQEAKSGIWYETDVVIEEKLEYILSFKRPGENAYLAHVTLPKKVKILNPHHGDKIEQGRDILVEVTPGEKNLDITILDFEKIEGGISVGYSERAPGDTSSHKIAHNHTSTTGTAVAQIMLQRIRIGSQPDGLMGDTSGVQMDKIAIELKSK
ncbi:MAG: hypothetical protein SGJ18_11960 [Pseudomonadota bacterium]|nr:hypothetical protein [Pseudomonadota bacterium]